MGFLNSDIPIIVIDDDARGRERLASLLGPGGGGCSNVTTFSDPAEALVSLPVDTTVVVLCEQNLPGASGVEWLLGNQRDDGGWHASPIGIYWEVIGGYANPINAWVFPMFALHEIAST